MRYSGSVQSLIADLILEFDLHSNDARKLSNFFGDALRELNNDTLLSIVEIRKELPSNRIIKMPEDYLDWCKIGVLYQQGVKTLAENRYAAIGVSLEGAQSLYRFQDGISSNPEFYGFQWYGAEGGRNQSFGNGDNLGGFYIDKPNRTITFEQRIPTGPIYLAYLSDCRENNVNTIVHPYCIEWAKVYVMKKFFFVKGDARYQELKQAEIIECKQMRKRVFSISKEDFVNIYEQQFGANE
jgi:hypothetical protein